jgi:hypothetical protein
MLIQVNMDVLKFVLAVTAIIAITWFVGWFLIGLVDMDCVTTDGVCNCTMYIGLSNLVK